MPESVTPPTGPSTSSMAHEPDAARLGNPSFVWRSGQERRLALIERYVPLHDRRVLDLGCGLGEYVRAFARRGARALGTGLWKAGDQAVIDGAVVNGSWKVGGWVSGMVRWAQTGYLYHYALVMIVGVFVFLTWFVWLNR